MKSAYELAMSRLKKTAPSLELNADQKRMLAEIDSEFEARIAEQRIFIDGEIAKAFADDARVPELRKQLAYEIASLEEKREAKKDKVRRENVS
jgi:ABC-type enterochelin transport system substrate-binding protein